MNHVIGSDQELDLGIHWQYQWFVDIQQVVFYLFRIHTGIKTARSIGLGR